MTKARFDGLTMLLLGALVFVAMGILLVAAVPIPFTDFSAIYYAARCLVQHHDPYQVNQLWAVYQAQGGLIPSDPHIYQGLRTLISTCVNFPTTLALVVPLAVLPWKLSLMIWLVLTGSSFVLACCWVWNVGANSAPRAYGLLILFLLANSGFLLFSANTAGVVISLCVIATCCFVEDRFRWVGVVCMALSLIVKPHDAGLIWLYFILAGGVRRKRAVQSLAVAAALAISAFTWTWHLVPNWLAEYRSNLIAISSPGGFNDPGAGRPGLGMMVSLNVALSRIWNAPHFYNLGVLAVCGSMLLIWCLATVRARFSPDRAWIALAAISALTLLATYHRDYDARLLLLTVPGCAVLWKRGGAAGWIATLLTVSAIAVTGDITWIVLTNLKDVIRAVTTEMVAPPLTLLAVSAFYLWVYVRATPRLWPLNRSASPHACSTAAAEPEADDILVASRH